jgi:hypothetical protein
VFSVIPAEAADVAALRRSPTVAVFHELPTDQTEYQAIFGPAEPFTEARAVEVRRVREKLAGPQASPPRWHGVSLRWSPGPYCSCAGPTTSTHSATSCEPTDITVRALFRKWPLDGPAPPAD